MMLLLLVAYSAIILVGFSTVYTLTKGARALRGYFGPPMRSKNKSCSSQVSSY